MAVASDSSSDRIPGWQTELVLPLLVDRAVEPRSESGELILRWLTQDIERFEGEVDTESLAAAVDCGLSTYWCFIHGFAAFFLEPEARGPEYVKRSLRRHFGFVDDRMIEAVLNRIRDRRLHLLDGFCRKYQRSLFKACALDPKKLRGYLIRVATIESLHVPHDDLPWNVGRITNFESLSEPPAADWDPESFERQTGQAVQQLIDFWGPDNGFTPDQKLEGLVTLGLGFCTGHSELEQRCAALLQAKLPEWEEVRMRLHRLASRLLRRWEDRRRQFAVASGGVSRHTQGHELASLEDRLIRVRQRIARHLTRLRPRPAEVQQLLEGLVANTSNVRFRRIAHEIAILERRVATGRRMLLESLPGTVPSAVQQLSEKVERHMAGRPPSPSAHRLTPAERDRRVKAMGGWLAEGERLLQETQAIFRDLDRSATSRAALWPALCYLGDVEDCYHLGVLTRKGVLPALGKRHGWRLERLLRGGR